MKRTKSSGAASRRSGSTFTANSLKKFIVSIWFVKKKTKKQSDQTFEGSHLHILGSGTSWHETMNESESKCWLQWSTFPSRNLPFVTSVNIFFLFHIEARNVFFLYPTIIWQRMCFMPLPNTPLDYFSCELGGIRLTERMGKNKNHVR